MIMKWRRHFPAMAKGFGCIGLLSVLYAINTAFDGAYSVQISAVILFVTALWAITTLDWKIVVRYEIRRARTYSTDDIRTFSGWMTDLLLTGREKETADQIRTEMLDAMWQIGSVALRNPDIYFSMIGEAKLYVAEAKSRAKAA